ncbi:hypothetical protein H4S07_001898 [Coemansia furcata]|uniref:Uncharacterized protein n=1 Tax=Coemansia furcata TaxID=417177 RepID=A0ACC1LMD5_9FUNG|nr:hypothetical protein H4S07_001898 [Coemansia furcata]
MSLTSAASSSSTTCEAVQLGKLTPTHQGWLYRYSSSSFLKSWKRRYYVLADERLYMFKDSSPHSHHHCVIDLTTFRSVQQISNPRKTKYGFLLRTLRRPSVFDDPTAAPQEMFELELYTETETALLEWMSAVSKVFVTMDLRSFQSPVSSFDALVQRAGNLQPRLGGSILNRMDKRRVDGGDSLSHSLSSSTLVSASSPVRMTMTPLDEYGI